MVGTTVPVATEQDLMPWTDRHALRRFAACERDDEGLLDFHRHGINHCHTAGPSRLAVDSWDGDVELAGAIIPLTMLVTVVRLRRSIRYIERNRGQHRIGLGRI